MRVSLEVTTAVVPNLPGARDQFREGQFSHRSAVVGGGGRGEWGGDGFVMIQAHYMCCA